MERGWRVFHVGEKALRVAEIHRVLRCFVFAGPLQADRSDKDNATTPENQGPAL